VVIEELVVVAEVRARPADPSAMHPTCDHPLGKGDFGLINPGVGGAGLQVGLGPVPTQRGLQPGSARRGEEEVPSGSFTIGSSGLQAAASTLSIRGLNTGQSECNVSI
jgi:hypothetical protein